MACMREKGKGKRFRVAVCPDACPTRTLLWPAHPLNSFTETLRASLFPFQQARDPEQLLQQTKTLGTVRLPSHVHCHRPGIRCPQRVVGPGHVSMRVFCAPLPVTVHFARAPLQAPNSCDGFAVVCVAGGTSPRHRLLVGWVVTAVTG